MDGLEIVNTSELTSQTHNNSRNIIHPLWNLDYFVLSVLISVLSLVGIVGNIPVLIVYIRRKDKKASNTFIQFLSFLDLLVCSLIMPYSVVYEFHLVTSDVTCRTFEVVRHFSIMASNVTLVAIAVERYVAVCQIGTKISLKNIKKGVWAIVFVSLILAAPAVGTFAVVNETEVQDIKCNFPHETTSGRFCHFTFSIMGKNLVLIYQLVQMTMFCLVLLVIVVLYTIIYVVLWKKTKIRQQLTKRHMSTASSYPTSFTDTFLTELAEKCKKRPQITNGINDKNAAHQLIPLNSTDSNNMVDLDDELSSTETETSNNKPETKTSNNKPDPETSNNKPETEISNNPETDTSNNKPETEISNNKPETEISNNPGTEISNNPETDTSNNKSETDTGSNNPETVTSNNKPETVTNNHTPEIGTSNNKPETKVTFQNNIDNGWVQQKHEFTTVVTASESRTNAHKTFKIKSEEKRLKSSFSAADKPRKKRHYHRRTAKMLFLCTVIYFVTWLPFWLDIFGLTNSLTLRYLFFIGNASNPIVYGIVNEQVRKAIKKLFMSYCGRWCSSSKYSEDNDNTLNCSSSLSH